MQSVMAWLDEPPHVANVGQSVHGTVGLHDVFRLPDLWQLHLYRYTAELTVQAETGNTVVGYIRHRRLERARHLLRESTLSIPAIAAAVGIRDLQAFNKACRRELGASPRAVRAGWNSRS